MLCYVISVLDKGGRNGEDERETYTTNVYKGKKVIGGGVETGE
jgi:hypothetical protein